VAKLDDLLNNFARQVALPWDHNLAGPQRIWFVVYDKADERRLRARVPDFETKTKEAGHGWRIHDVSDAFGRWMAGRKYRDRYFERPELLASAMDDFRATVIAGLQGALGAEGVDRDTVVAVQGIAGLFGFLLVSDLMHAVEAFIRGRLLVFFPGEHTGNRYRLLDARDGWDYLATPITSYQRASAP
jgi:hypothetical protein